MAACHCQAPLRPSCADSTGTTRRTNPPARTGRRCTPHTDHRQRGPILAAEIPEEGFLSRWGTAKVIINGVRFGHRDWQIAELAAIGHPQKVISGSLGISQATIKVYLSRLYYRMRTVHPELAGLNMNIALARWIWDYQGGIAAAEQEARLSDMAGRVTFVDPNAGPRRR